VEYFELEPLLTNINEIPKYKCFGHLIILALPLLFHALEHTNSKYDKYLILSLVSHMILLFLLLVLSLFQVGTVLLYPCILRERGI
jgi:hypothetical protein